MTDLPYAALYVCGTSDINMQNASLTADMLKTALHRAGFTVGAHMEKRLTGAKEDVPVLRDGLLHLTAVCDLVVTVGAVGFGRGDILPDVTNRLCTGRADYFAGILCGAYPIPCHDEALPPPSSLPPFVPAAERRKRERRLLWFGFAPRRSAVSQPSSLRVPVQRLSHPSRAAAGIIRQTLLVNFPSDVSDARMLADALLPSLAFAVFRLCGKAAERVTVCDDSVNV